MRFAAPARISIIAALGAWLAPDAALASPMDGSWKVVWPCSTARDAFLPERCREGDNDYFELQLWSTGTKLCGVHAATARLGNRVDEVETWGPSVVGVVGRGPVTVQFRSHWGATGHATLRLVKGRLHWRVIDSNETPDTHDRSSWIPDRAVLRRQRPSDKRTPPACTGLLAPDV